MQLISSTITYRRLINAYIALVGLFAFATGLLIPRISRDWIIGDWLINYQGHFVRRGLPGEIVYLLGRHFHVSPIFFVICIYMALTAVFLSSFRRIALGTSGSFWIVAILLSPATLGFQPLHIQAGFHKDYIFLAAIALLLAQLLKRDFSSKALSIYIAACLVVAVLSHESAIFYAPYFFAALIIAGRTPLQAAKVCALPFALAIVAAFVCSHNLGNTDTAVRICQSLGAPVTTQANQLCSSFGAINYLGYTRAMAHEDAMIVIRRFHYLQIYPVLAALAFLPLIAESVVLARSGYRTQIRVLWSTAALSIAGSIVLFVYAIDWGRWIYIHVISIALMLLFLDSRKYTEAADRNPPVMVAPRRLRWAGAVFLAAYATLWSLPHFIKEPVRLGYVGLVHDAIHNKDRRQKGRPGRHDTPVIVPASAASR